MGEIAESMINGELCSGCGVYLGEETGYPCYCDDCREGEDKEEFPAHPDNE